MWQIGCSYKPSSLETVIQVRNILSFPLPSSLLQQYKVELNKAERSNLDEDNENEDNETILNEMMIFLLDSTRHYMKKCSESEKVFPS